MTAQQTPVAESDPRFSAADATALPWSAASDLLETAELFWVSTVRPDGRPHATTLQAIWMDGALYFSTGFREQEAKNLQRNTSVVLTTGCNTFAGLDEVKPQTVFGFGKGEPFSQSRWRF